MTPFSSRRVKSKIRQGIARKRRQILGPLSRDLVMKLEAAENPALIAPQIDEFLTLSNSITCSTKPSYSFEEAGARDHRENPEVEPYLCKQCGFLHFGHVPQLLVLFRAKIMGVNLTK